MSTTKKESIPTPEGSTTSLELVVKSEPKAATGLLADAQAAKPLHEKVDQQQADEHKELREEGKIIEPTPITGYEQARENLYVEQPEKTLTDAVTSGDQTT